MRVSTLRTSALYTKNAQVLLDGRPMAFAVEADDEEGWVDVLDLVSKENPLPTKRLHGQVEIREAP